MLVEQESDLLAERVRVLILEIHPQPWALGEEGAARLVERLVAAGFVHTEVDGYDHVFLRSPAPAGASGAGGEREAKAATTAGEEA